MTDNIRLTPCDPQRAADIDSLVWSLRQLASYQHSDVSIAEEAADLILELMELCRDQ